MSNTMPRGQGSLEEESVVKESLATAAELWETVT